MPTVRDPATHAALRARLERLRPDAPRQWGKMSVDQMLWHLSIALEMACGERPCEPKRIPVPRAFMRWVALNLPWPKGAPTAPEMIAGARYDFEEERARCLGALGRLAAKPLDSAWPLHPAFGRMTGAQWGVLQAKHIDHHLRQFGA